MPATARAAFHGLHELHTASLLFIIQYVIHDSHSMEALYRMSMHLAP